MNRTKALAALSLFAVADAAVAGSVAKLVDTQGMVLVNRGEAFVSVVEGQAVQAGDRVMLLEGASAVLAFADGCELPLGAGALLEVPALSTCAGGVASVQALGPVLAQAEKSGEEADSEPAPFMKTPGGIAVAAAAVAAVAVATGGGSDGDDPPVSP